MTQKFNVSQFVGQFILRNGAMPVPEGWAEKSIGTWHLAHHASLPAILLHGVDGSPVGWLLGYPIDGNGLLLSDGDERNLPGPSNSTESGVEDFIYGFGGRFLVALVNVQQPRIYLDPCGSLSIVYCAHQEVVASTPNLIPYDEQSRDRLDLIKLMGIPNTNAQYPLELTPRHNVERLIPNHYLDLSNWHRMRHWPMKPLHSEGSVEEAVPIVADITKRHIAAIVSRTPTYLRLTAGGDSRMLLSCARDVIDRMELFTVPIPDDGGYLDTAIARKIARRFRLRHFVPRFQKPRQEDLDEYMFRIGYSTGEPRGWQAATMFKQANRKFAQLDGAVGALERGGFYRIHDTESSRITPERLLEHCRAPRSEIALSTLQRWLETVPAVDTFQLLDLFLIEQLLGCWSGILPYAEARDPGLTIFPMCHREIITRMITLPTQYRLLGFHTCERFHTGPPPFMKEIIEREWPELLAWPFNKPVGLERITLTARRATRSLDYQAGRVGKALRNPVWAAGKIGERIKRRLMSSLSIH